jgi:hypothetical protein
MFVILSAIEVPALLFHAGCCFVCIEKLESILTTLPLRGHCDINDDKYSNSHLPHILSQLQEKLTDIQGGEIVVGHKYSGISVTTMRDSTYVSKLNHNHNKNTYSFTPIPKNTALLPSWFPSALEQTSGHNKVTEKHTFAYRIHFFSLSYQIKEPEARSNANRR